MKTSIKYLLSELGVLPKVDFIRRLPEIAHWIRMGCTGVAPPPIKRMIVAAYLERYRLDQFIETGTHAGDTLAYIAHNKAVSCISVELSHEYYQAALRRFANYTNVILKQGDSSVVLAEVVRDLRSPALFWLDGHYSGGNTARGVEDTPVSAELSAILNSSIKTNVILIDDAHCFDGKNAYPQLEVLLQTIRRLGAYHIEISDDIIRLTPKS
jgi:hypothetical protein